MGKSSVEWTDNSWNPIRGTDKNRWMCKHRSPGCDYCYADTMNHRWGGSHYLPIGDGVPEVTLSEKILLEPMKWKRPALTFVCDMTDLFGEWVPRDYQERMFDVMRQCPQHTFQVLTKRPDVMYNFMREREPLPNVWLGVSIEMDRFHWRANILCATPAAIRFISAEPLLGPLPTLNLNGIDWLIAGGESGARHRPCDLGWVRDLRDRCQAKDIAFFFKQWGGRTHAEGGCEIDGLEIKQFPQPRLPGLAA